VDGIEGQKLLIAINTYANDLKKIEN